MSEPNELQQLAAQAEVALRTSATFRHGTMTIQRAMHCGYNKAAEVMTYLEEIGVISHTDSIGERRLLR